jgi:hypothetical protein
MYGFFYLFFGVKRGGFYPKETGVWYSSGSGMAFKGQRS